MHPALAVEISLSSEMTRAAEGSEEAPKPKPGPGGPYRAASRVFDAAPRYRGSFSVSASTRSTGLGASETASCREASAARYEFQRRIGSSGGFGAMLTIQACPFGSIKILYPRYSLSCAGITAASFLPPVALDQELTIEE